MSIAEFTRDPDLLALVAAEIEAVHADAAGPWPDPSDVIADVLDEVRRDLRDEADGGVRCHKVDTCTASAIVRNRLADWIEGEL